MRFENRNILVIGCATGMGRATVTQLANEGANVIAFDILADRLEELKAELAGAPGTIDTFAGDVTNLDDIKRHVAYVTEKYGTLDTLAYVAGVMDFMTPLEDCDDALWDYVMNVNMNACFRMCRECMPLLVDHEGTAAKIAIVGSVGGIYGSTAGPAYIASKHAVLGLARCLGWELKTRNVRVNVVNPGCILTDISFNGIDTWEKRGINRTIVHPAGMEYFFSTGSNAISDGLTGDPEDIASAICYLISDEAKFISGAQLTVDGGWTTF